MQQIESSHSFTDFGNRGFVYTIIHYICQYLTLFWPTHFRRELSIIGVESVTKTQIFYHYYNPQQTNTVSYIFLLDYYSDSFIWFIHNFKPSLINSRGKHTVCCFTFQNGRKRLYFWLPEVADEKKNLLREPVKSMGNRFHFFSPFPVYWPYVFYCRCSLDMFGKSSCS